MAEYIVYWSRTEDFQQVVEVDDADVLVYLGNPAGQTVEAKDVRAYLESRRGESDEDDPNILLNTGDGEWMEASDPVIHDVVLR